MSCAALAAVDPARVEEVAAVTKPKPKLQQKKLSKHVILLRTARLALLNLRRATPLQNRQFANSKHSPKLAV